MSDIWNFLQPAISKFFPLVILLSGMSNTVYAQGKDMAEGAKAKAMVDEARKEEREMRAKSKEELNEKRQRAIQDLEKVLKKYQSPSDKEMADLITKEINLLKEKLGIPVGEENDIREASNNLFFNYRTEYFFDEKGIIKGKFIFMPNEKVRVIYSYKDKQESKFWDWKDMGDHIQVKADESLGTIIISEQPNSNLKSLLIRWGGELIHKLTDAHSD